MNPDGLSGVSDLFKDYCYDFQQTTLSVVPKLKEFRNNPHFFQKVCQIASNCIQFLILHFPAKAYLEKLSVTLLTSNMHDFYSFLKKPRLFFFPVSVDTIDEIALLKSLKTIIQQDLQKSHISTPKVDKQKDLLLDDSDISDQNQPVDKNVVNQACLDAKNCIFQLLKEMGANNDAYTVEEFKKLLKNRLQSIQPSNFNFKEIELNDLKISFRHVPLLEKLTSFTWTLVDVGCVLFYSRTWELVDTAKWAQRIGQYPGCQWVRNQKLDVVLLGLVIGAFTLKLIEATRKLQDEVLTKEEKHQAHWDRITAATESVLWGATLTNFMGKTMIPNSNIYLFAIFTKSLGLLSIIFRPDRQFFQKEKISKI